MDDLSQRWLARQAALQSLLRAHGAEGQDFRADLAEGRFWWQDRATQQPSVIADTRLLGSWALSNGSLMPSWCNQSVPASVQVAPVAGVATDRLTRDEHEVWAWAWQIAEGAGADFVYRVPTPQNWIFLGLWNLRAASASDLPDHRPHPPWLHVARVLRTLRDEADVDAQVLAHNYGQSFIADAAELHRGTAWQATLRTVGERLMALSAASPGARRAGLADLLAQVEAMIS